VTVLFFVAVAAAVCAILSAMSRCPIWVSVMLLALYALIQQLPVGK